VLADTGLADQTLHLLQRLSLLDAEEACAQDRVRFISSLKDVGIAELKVRQSVANAIGRSRRRRYPNAMKAISSGAVVPPTPVVLPASDPCIHLSR
jgi:hypothetical protein